MAPTLPMAGPTQHTVAQFTAAAAELASREQEALRLYRPLPFQDAFHRCTAKECLLMKGNQAGGSVAGFVEDARAATGCDPYGKYPKENGLIACIGYGENHIGRVIYRYLFQEGAFKIVRDLVTRQWRVFRPWAPDKIKGGYGGDQGREEEAKNAPPLIPKRFVKGFAWECRAKYVFSSVELVNGWKIYAANSAGDPNQFQGIQLDLAHIDEDTAMPGWYSELLNRLSIRKGLLRWTALPHLKNDELIGMLDRAEEQETAAVPTTIAVRASAYDNPYYPDESKAANEQILKQAGEEEYRKRMLGEISRDTISMYPMFHPNLHAAVKYEEPRVAVQRILADRGGEPPLHWTRYLSVDPGHTVCAVSFFTVPPLDMGLFKIQYAELYIRQCTAPKLAAQVEPFVKDKAFQAFIIDMHGGMLADIATGIHPVRQYQDAFAALGIASVETGSGFLAGCDDVDGRTLRLRSAMGIRRDGSTEYMVINHTCPMTLREFKRFRKKIAVVNGTSVTLDEGERRGIHLIDTIEMAVAHGLPYVAPPAAPRQKTKMQKIVEERVRRYQESSAASRNGRVIILGPA